MLNRSLIAASFGLALVACGGSAVRTPTATEAGGAGAGGATGCSSQLATAQELASTPRADTNLELLSLKVSAGVVASSAAYRRVVRDVAAIRELAPGLAGVAYFPPHDGRAIFLSLDAQSLQLMRAERYHEWDCLNRIYGVERIDLADEGSLLPHATVQLKGIYDIERLALEYASLSGVQSAGPNVAGGDGPTICLTADDADVWHYVLDEASGDCPAGCISHVLHHFSTELGGELRSLGQLTPELARKYASLSACR